MTYQWIDCDRSTVSGRYDRIAEFIPFFDRLLFLPGDMRRKAVVRLGLRRGDSVLDIGCGTGVNFPYLRDAVGPSGHIYGVDISPGMLGKARQRRERNGWHNIELTEGDVVEYTAPVPLDGVLFSLSYNTMPHHRTVLHHAWRQLRPGGRLVIMDAKLPPGLSGRLLLPFSLWLMRHTMLGNPLIHPWEELAEIVASVDMRECLFSSYYICCATKPSAASNDNDSPDIGRQIAAE